MVMANAPDPTMPKAAIVLLIHNYETTDLLMI